LRSGIGLLNVGQHARHHHGLGWTWPRSSWIGLDLAKWTLV